MPSSTSDTITNIVFGLCALAVGTVTIWQGRKAWVMWYPSESQSSEEHQSTAVDDVELGQAEAPGVGSYYVPGPDVGSYFVPGYGISHHIIFNHIHSYLGPNASVRPYFHQGHEGYLVTAGWPLTKNQMDDLRVLSKHYEQGTESMIAGGVNQWQRPLSPWARRPELEGTIPGGEGSSIPLSANVSPIGFET